MTQRVLLLGATGFFGHRLARHLAGIQGLELVLTSRSLARSDALCRDIRSAASDAHISAVAFDRDDAGVAENLRILSPWLVIDASGPFQASNYDLARAAVQAGAHWMDLADARGYLTGFGAALDNLAREHGVVALAGASSTPALSTAVADELTRGWRRVDTIDMAIYPGGGARVGLAVIEALLHYAGRPIATFREGSAQHVTGWGSHRRQRLPDIDVRYLAPVETADDALLPERLGVTSRVSFAAGLESRLEHFGLMALAWLRSRGFVTTLLPLAPWLEAARGITRRFASDRGGMSVDCAGIDANGEHVFARWWLLAEQGEGPHVPVLPALALTRALLADRIPTGARTAAGVLPLADIKAEMGPLALQTSRTVIAGGDEGLFALATGVHDYRALPAALRAFHDGGGAPVWLGMADIDCGRGIVARIVRRVFGFPGDGRNVPVTVTVDRRGTDETWTRNFAGARFVSQLSHESDGTVGERFGPFTIRLGVRVKDRAIEMPVVGWRLGPLPLPRFLAPKSETREFADDQGRFNFDVRITIPLFGLLAHYRGWLMPQIRPAHDKGPRDTGEPLKIPA